MWSLEHQHWQPQRALEACRTVDPAPDLRLIQNLHFNNIPRWFLYLQKRKKCWSRKLLSARWEECKRVTEDPCHNANLKYQFQLTLGVSTRKYVDQGRRLLNVSVRLEPNINLTLKPPGDIIKILPTPGHPQNYCVNVCGTGSSVFFKTSPGGSNRRPILGTPEFGLHYIVSPPPDPLFFFF